jgi:hypothetical protein
MSNIQSVVIPSAVKKKGIPGKTSNVLTPLLGMEMAGDEM